MTRSILDDHSDKTVQVVGDIVETINSIDKSRRKDIAFRLSNVLDNIVSFSGDSEYYCDQSFKHCVECEIFLGVEI